MWYETIISPGKGTFFKYCMSFLPCAQLWHHSGVTFPLDHTECKHKTHRQLPTFLLLRVFTNIKKNKVFLPDTVVYPLKKVYYCI